MQQQAKQRWSAMEVLTIDNHQGNRYLSIVSTSRVGHRCLACCCIRATCRHKQPVRCKHCTIVSGSTEWAALLALLKQRSCLQEWTASGGRHWRKQLAHAGG